MDQILFVARDRSCASRSGDGQDLLRTICAFFKARKQAKFADGLLVVGLNHEKVSEVFKAAGFVADPSLEMGPQTLMAAAPPRGVPPGHPWGAERWCTAAAEVQSSCGSGLKDLQ